MRLVDDDRCAGQVERQLDDKALKALMQDLTGAAGIDAAGVTVSPDASIMPSVKVGPAVRCTRQTASPAM